MDPMSVHLIEACLRTLQILCLTIPGHVGDFYTV